MKMSDLKKKILMKVRRVEYKHVNYPEEYKETEIKYKKLRDNLNNVSASIANLMNYEHGGKAQKKLYQGLSIISSVSKLDYFKSHDVFESIGSVCSDFSKDDDQVSSENEKMSKGYFRVSEMKKKFNEKLQNEMEILKDIKKKTDQINKERDNAKVYRYDLEMAKENESHENRQEVDRYEELFDKACMQALSMMNDFIGDDGVQGVLKRVLGYNIEFFKKSLEELEKVNK
ncbi:spore wall protein 12 (SWP12) [Vairimorpha necatrix]|uniref:Spore wall protein 12 (SWP12) n=1 Tax=Vairimorpha necatrix TaxID=6039 RepID=A0AAX4JD47_9MICR